MNDRIPAWPFAILRIYAGLMFVGAAVVRFALPGGTPIGSLELMVGAALLLGAMTPVAAIVGVGIVAGHLLPIHSPSILISPGPGTALATLLVTVALGRAGRVLGLDGLLLRRKAGGSVVAINNVPRWTLVLLRVYLGAAFLNAATNKIGSNWAPWPGWMSGVIEDRMPGSIPLYGHFLSAIVLPNITFFSHAVACGEVAVGCLLITGLVTRAAAIGGALLALNYLLLNGAAQLWPGHDAIFTFGSNDPVFVLGCITLFVGAAGRALGVDRMLHRRFPRAPIS